MAYFFGPAGWSYDDWEGTVYPSPVPRGFNHLAFIGERFDFVEVNTSFYRVPSVRLTTGWINKTQHLPDFLFWMKIHQDITHNHSLDPSAIKAFFEAMKPLQEAKKLAGLLAQFPYSFAANRKNGDYIKAMLDKLQHCPVAIEFRHNSWNRHSVHDFFRSNALILVNVDQPQISASLPLTAIATHPEIAYFRLHGRNSKNWFGNQGRNARYDYFYSPLELQSIAGFIQKLKAEAKKIFVSGNNHYKGSAIKNLLMLKSILRQLPNPGSEQAK